MTYKNLLRFVSFLFLSFLFIVVFLNQHSHKGAFHTDEPGIVLMSFDSRDVYKIYKEVAYTSQPPFEEIFRGKVYLPIVGSIQNIAQRFPELFHRSESLAWWVLPLGFFFVFYQGYSNKNRYLIYLSFLFLLSSDFIGFYLAEAKNYSAIGASFALMIITLLQDKLPTKQRLKIFLITSALIPLLHIVSFVYYLFLNILVLIYLWVNANKKERGKFLKIFFSWSLYVSFVLILYLDIKRISSGWQHPSIDNIFPFIPINSYIKWTLDWAFFKTPVYFLYSVIPTTIKNNLLFILPLLSIPQLYKNVLNIFRKQNNLPIMSWLLLTVLIVWPANVVLFRYVSGWFQGERYSIGIIVIIFFLISFAITEIIWSKLKKTYLKHIFLIVCILICSFFVIKQINFNFQLITPEDVFISQNRSLLENPNNILIVDNGIYTYALMVHAMIDGYGINSELHYCRFGEFFVNNKNVLNEWLENNKSRNVYLFTTPHAFLNQGNQLVWKYQNRVLYKLTSLIPQQGLCPNRSNMQECYLTCLKGYAISADGRSVPDMVPHIDIWRD